MSIEEKIGNKSVKSMEWEDFKADLFQRQSKLDRMIEAGEAYVQWGEKDEKGNPKFIKVFRRKDGILIFFADLKGFRSAELESYKRSL